jgi:YHS domain-containing protein
MGEPITRVHGNQEVKFCCKPCATKFEKNPQRYLAAL